MSQETLHDVGMSPSKFFKNRLKNTTDKDDRLKEDKINYSIMQFYVVLINYFIFFILFYMVL